LVSAFRVHERGPARGAALAHDDLAGEHECRRCVYPVASQQPLPWLKPQEVCGSFIAVKDPPPLIQADAHALAPQFMFASPHALLASQSNLQGPLALQLMSTLLLEQASVPVHDTEQK